MYTKKLLMIISYFIIGYACVWMFNHVHPWISILFALTIGVITFYQFEKNLKK